MPRKLTKEEFIEKAQKVHGDKYDYSKVDYVNNSTKVCILCKKHGTFWQTPNHHLNGHACQKCKGEQVSKSLKGVAKKTSRKKVCGIGLFDLDSALNTETRRIYYIWRAMIKRCYDLNDPRSKTYKDCRVCDEWLCFSNFYKWYVQNYIKGWCLDKDILSKENKVYSPDTCCFVPNEINTVFNKHQNKRGKTNVCGVQYFRNKYHAFLSIHGKRRKVGTFNNINEAFYAYKKHKEQYIRNIAEKWIDKLDSKVYNALVKYEVKITD